MKIQSKNAYYFTKHCVNLWNLCSDKVKENEHGLPEILGMYIYEKLKRVELKANRNQLAEMNQQITEEAAAKVDEQTRKAVIKIMGHLPEGFFINGDARGYTLKLKVDKKPRDFYTDMGGYGILAPEF